MQWVLLGVDKEWRLFRQPPLIFLASNLAKLTPFVNPLIIRADELDCFRNAALLSTFFFMSNWLLLLFSVVAVVGGGGIVIVVAPAIVFDVAAYPVLKGCRCFSVCKTYNVHQVRL